MIIKLLIDLIYTVVSVLTAPINIPDLPSDVNSFISTAIEYIGTGLGILSNYTNLSYLLVLFGVIIAIDVGLALYKLVMFIIKKIPMLGIN